MNKEIKQLHKKIKFIDKKIEELSAKDSVLTENDLLKIKSVYNERRTEIKNEIKNLVQDI